MNARATKMRTRDLAATYGVSDDTINRWASVDRRLGACRWRKGWWDIVKRRRAGFVEREVADVA